MWPSVTQTIPKGLVEVSFFGNFFSHDEGGKSHDKCIVINCAALLCKSTIFFFPLYTFVFSKRRDDGWKSMSASEKGVGSNTCCY